MTESLEKKTAELGKESKKKTQSELAEVVRKHNAKYNEMLKERMEAEEAAKAELQVARGEDLAVAPMTLGGEAQDDEACADPLVVEGALLPVESLAAPEVATTSFQKVANRKRKKKAAPSRYPCL